MQQVTQTKVNPMKVIRIEKLTLNIGAGTDPARLTKGVQLLTNIAGKPPVKTITQKRIANWGIRPGLPIGCKITLRGAEAAELLPRLLAAKDNELNETCFDGHGNVAFGIHEYINIPGVKYDPNIGITGLQACITLERPGYRIKRRKISKRKINPVHGITHEQAVQYFKENYKVQVRGEE
ncbi:MAG: 50S ribosomal protein L5 [Nanoarchaeota archaeon]